MIDLASLPRKPLGATTSTREQMAEEGRKSLYFFCKVILGYTDLNPRTHGDLCTFLDSADYPRRMILMPRNTFKTTIATIADSIRHACIDPNIRILIVADTGTNAGRFLTEIKMHFERNELFRWVYQEIIRENPSKRWNQNELEVKRSGIFREPTFDAIGAGGGIESRHYDYIKADDLLTEKHIHSDTEMKSVIKWSRGLESLLDGVDKRIDFVGSRKKKGDLYEKIQKDYDLKTDPVSIGPWAELRGSIAVFSRNIIHEGRSIFPERIPVDFLSRLRSNDPGRYFAQYANSPKGTGLNMFRKDWIKFFRLETREIGGLPRFYIVRPDGVEIDIMQLERVTLYDPAKSEKNENSKNAQIVVAKGSTPERYILHTHIGHYKPDEAVDHLYWIDSTFACSIYSIEHRGYQGSIKYWLNERSSRENLPILPVIEYPRKGSPHAMWAKPERIRALQPLFRAGYIWMQEEQEDLIEEIEYYPNVEWNDGLDCLAQGLDIWPYSIDAEQIERERDEEKKWLERVGVLSRRKAEESQRTGPPRLNSTGYRRRKRVS